ncbi:MAG: hypothetical protein AB7K68_01230 [Bacteriovoracia bacterium]
MRYLLFATTAFLFSFGLFFLRNNSQPEAPASPSPRVPASPASPAAALRPLVSSVPPAATVGQSRPELLENLRRHSSGPWRMAWVEGVLTEMSGARLSLGETDSGEAAKKFLRDYAGLLGIAAGELRVQSRRSMDQSQQVISAQTINGLPVFDSRINTIFDSAGNLIYLSNNSYSGPTPARGPVVTPELAAQAAQAALAIFRRSQGDEGEAVSASDILIHALLGYRLTGSAIALVYKFTISIPRSPLGDVEILLDAADGTTLLVRKISRN